MTPLAESDLKWNEYQFQSRSSPDEPSEKSEVNSQGSATMRRKQRQLVFGMGSDLSEGDLDPPMNKSGLLDLDNSDFEIELVER